MYSTIYQGPPNFVISKFPDFKAEGLLSVISAIIMIRPFTADELYGGYSYGNVDFKG